MEIEKNTSEVLINTDKSTNSLISLKVLLLQALDNKDTELLKFIFHNENKLIIRSTLENFTESKNYENFLKIMLDILESLPSEGKYIMKWLNTFLKVKKDILKENGLLGYLDERSFFFMEKLNNLNKKENLKTKLDLLLDKLKQKKEKNFSFGKSKIFIDETKEESEIVFFKKYDEKKNMKEIRQKIENDQFEEEEDVEKEELEILEEEMNNERNKINKKKQANLLAMESEENSMDKESEEEDNEN
jgi:hypothetical protein